MESEKLQTRFEVDPRMDGDRVSTESQGKAEFEVHLIN